MVRLDAKNWMKCGTEFFDGQRRLHPRFFRLVRHPDLSPAAPVWWRAARKKNSIENSCSLDGKTFTFVRSGYFPRRVKVNGGIVCTAPRGQDSKLSLTR
jgi:uncharacterized protein